MDLFLYSSVFSWINSLLLISVDKREAAGEVRGRMGLPLSATLCICAGLTGPCATLQFRGCWQLSCCFNFLSTWHLMAGSSTLYTSVRHLLLPHQEKAPTKPNKPLVCKSQHHRKIQVGRHLWVSTPPSAPSRVIPRLGWVAQGLAQVNPEHPQLWIITACCALAFSTAQRPRWLWSAPVLTRLGDGWNTHNRLSWCKITVSYSPSKEAGAKELELLMDFKIPKEGWGLLCHDEGWERLGSQNGEQTKY